MSLKNTDVRTPGIAAIAKKFNLPIAKVVRLVNVGAKTEFEHNKNLAKAKQVARDHISERPDYYQKLKKMEKSPVSLKEETSVSAVRGLGYVSGDPAVDPVGQYIDTNAMAYEDQNGNILKLIKKSNKVNSLGFTSYDPTEDHGDVKTRILGKKIMKEASINELSGGDSRDTEGGVSGLPKSAYRRNDIEEGKKLEKVKKIVRGAMVAANLATLGQVAGDAAEGRGSPKRSVVAVASTKSGIPGWGATGAHYGLKVKDFLKKKSLQEIKATTVGRAVAHASAKRKEMTSKGHMSQDDTKRWWKYQRFVEKGTQKLTGKSKVPPTLDEYANTPSNEYTKPYITKSLVRTGRASHEHISKPDTVEEPGRGGKVSPNGK